MTQFGSQVQTAVHVRLASAAALDTCTYSSASSVLPSNTDLGAKLVATSNGALTIDGVAAAVDDEVLIKDQVATLQNGVYRVRSIGGTASTWSLERSKQARDSGQFDGMIVTTGADGSANPSAIFLYSGVVSPVIGTDAITFAAETGADLSLYAKLASPHFSGVPTAPTAAVDTNTTQLATTAFVMAEIPAFVTINPAVVTANSGDSSNLTAAYIVNNWIFHSAALMAAYTVSMDNGLYPGQIIYASFNNVVTALTMSGTNLSTAGLAQPTSVAANQNFGWAWDVTSSKWVRFQ